MKKNTFCFFYFLLLMNSVISQQYIITNNPVNYYTIDRFTNLIYYQQKFPYEGVYKTDFDGNNHVKTEFENPPIFAHNSHKAVIVEWNGNDEFSYFLFNFETKEKKYLFKTDRRIYFGNISFSWDDSLLFIYNAPLIYYSFKDSTLYYEKNINLYSDSFIWHKDNDKILPLEDNVIFSYSIKTNQRDTIVTTEESNQLFSFAYNPKNNLLTYSVLDLIGDTNYIYTKNLTNGNITNIYKSYNIYNTGQESSGWITKMSWNKEGTKLAFTSEPYIHPHVENFYLYDSQYDTTYQYAEYNEGFSYQLQWLDSNRISYTNASIGDKLMSFLFDKPLSVEENKITKYSMNLSAYPNPFNSQIQIEYSIPNQGKVEVSIYNILGQKITTIFNDYKESGNYRVVWNGKDELNNSISSGLYIVKLSMNVNNKIIDNHLKIILLK